MTNLINKVIKTFPIDSKLGQNLMSLLVGKVSPEQIKAIGVNLNLSKVSIEFYTSPVAELVGQNKSVTDTFTAMPGFNYLSGLVRSNGVVLTGIAEGIFGKNNNLLILLIETIDHLFYGAYGDYHMTLLTPEIPREYAIQVDDRSWRVFKTTTAELMRDGTMVIVRYKTVSAITKSSLPMFIRGNEPLEQRVVVPWTINHIQHLDAFGTDEFAVTLLNGSICIVKIERDLNQFVMREVVDVPPAIEGQVIKQCLGTLWGDRRIVTSVYYRTSMGAQFTLRLVA